MTTEDREWVLYLFGWGRLSPVGVFDTVEAAQKMAGIGQPIQWTKSHENGWVGRPFDGKPDAGFYYTINRDGRAVYDQLRNVPEYRNLYSDDLNPASNPIPRWTATELWGIALALVLLGVAVVMGVHLLELIL